MAVINWAYRVSRVGVQLDEYNLLFLHNFIDIVLVAGYPR